MLPERITAMQSLMALHQADQLIVSDPSTIFYLTGTWFSPGERLIVLILDRTGEPILLSNELFPLPADFPLSVRWYNDTEDAPARVSELLNGGFIAVDKTWPARFLLPLQALAPERRFILASPIADGARLIKDAEEQARMRRASHLNDAAMTDLLARIGSQTDELVLTQQLADLYASLDCDGFSFPPIVAFGANCADPHHESDDSRPRAGDSIILDIGCRKDDYCSDMTRTVFFREVSEEGRRIYETVRQANLLAIAAVRPGARFSDVDRAARAYIESQGYGPNFTHRTGHGIGIDVHEPEDVSAVNDHLLRPGMIFSIEPGIYLPGRLGVRIEDLVLVTETGCEVLNHVSKDLLVIDPSA